MEELVSRPPQIKAELAELEIAEGPRDEVPAGIEVPRPLPEGEEIAPAVVVDDVHLEIRLPQLVEEIVEHQEGVVAGIDVAHHEGRQLVFLLPGAAVEEHAAAGLEQRGELLQHALVIGQMLDHTHDDDGVELLLRLYS